MLLPNQSDCDCFDSSGQNYFDNNYLDAISLDDVIEQHEVLFVCLFCGRTDFPNMTIWNIFTHMIRHFGSVEDREELHNARSKLWTDALARYNNFM
jgi:hypothetical protein